MRYKAVIFDMDGTILNTLEDLKDSLNYSLKKFGHKGDFTTDEVKLFFGSGARAAISRALGAERGLTPLEILEIGKKLEDNRPEVTEILKFYKSYYREHSGIKTSAYSGIPELINSLIENDIKVAVVSNKPDAAVKLLCESYFPCAKDMNLAKYKEEPDKVGSIFKVALGETAGMERKPAPDMVIKAMEILGVTSEESVYIGDSEVDYVTAKNAAIPCISCDWGFRTREFLENMEVDNIVSHPWEILDIVLDKKIGI